MSKLERKIAVGLAAGLIAFAAAAFFLFRADDAKQPRLILRDYPGARVWSLAFFPDGKTIAAAGDAGICLWDAETGQLLKIETSLDGGYAAVSPDGEKIAAGGYGGNFVLWTVSTGLVETYHASRGESFYRAAFSPDSKTVAASVLEHAGKEKSTIRIWDIETGAPLSTLGGKTSFPSPLAYSPDSSQIAGGSVLDVKIWDLKTGAPLHTLKGHRYPVIAVAYSPDGSRLASASHDKSVKIWDAQTGALLHTLKKHREPLRFAAYLPDGERLISGGEDKLKIWDLKTGAPIQTLKQRRRRIMTAAVSPDGRFAAAAALDADIKTAVLIWDIDAAAPAP